MKIIEFLFLNWSDILLVFSVIVLIIYSFFTNRLGYLKAEIFPLVDEAEKLYGAKTGQSKLMFVVKKIYSKMPVFLKLFLSESQLEKMIEDVLQKAKSAWRQKAEGVM